MPAFAAQTVYRSIQDAYPGYTYREPALRPTNPQNLPSPFEVELINRFRADSDLKELAGVRKEGGGEVYYLARPLRVAERCMVCHYTPERAPNARSRSWKRAFSARVTVCTRAEPSTCVTAGMRSRTAGRTGNESSM